ncbi:MAG: response regulator [bacterium]|nr:response regulator [bacterium]
MEVGIVVGLTVLVVVVKGLITVWLNQMKSAIREAEAEESEVLARLGNIEAAKLQAERAKEALDREQKLLENEKDLLCVGIQKLGAIPIPEDELDAIEAAGQPVVAVAPASAEEETEEGTEEERAKEVSAVEKPPESVRFRILVVDDNTELRELLTQILSRKYDVDGAVDGYDALSRMIKQKEEFDLLITDLKMPNVNGIKLVENLPKKIPTIVISGFLQRDEFREAIEKLQPVAVFEKPFKMAELREVIENVFEKKS